MSVEHPNEQHAPMDVQLANYRKRMRDNAEGWRTAYEMAVRRRFAREDGGGGSKARAAGMVAVVCHYEYLLGEAIRQLGEWEQQGRR